jgi:peptidyl-prolyl cis-trans isomerase D
VEKVNEAATQPLEAVRETIRSKLATDKARALALNKAESVYDSVFDGDELAKVAEGQTISAATTEFFTKKNPPQKGIRNPRKFADTAFALEPMAISEIQDSGNGYYLLQVVDRKPPEVPGLDTVVEKVKADLILKMQKERATEEAGKLLEKVKSEGLPLAEAIAQTDLKAEDTGFFKRNGSIPTIGFEPQIAQAAFERTMDQPLVGEVVQGRNGAYVIRLKERRMPDEAGFQKEKEGLKERLAGQKKQSAMQQWLEDLKQRGQIDINRKLIE